MAGRISQTVVEAAEQGTPSARASQVVAEVDASGTPQARASQVVGEVEASGTPQARASQIVGEVIASGSPIPRISQVVVEALIRSITVTMPPVYPSLPGLGFSTFWAPKFFNMDEATGTGAEVDVALAGEPVHEFELTYDFLRGAFAEGGTEFKTFMGFWLRMGGQAGRFLFKNPKDYQVTNQAFTTTDGVNAVFGPLTRSFGLGENIGTEAIGYVDPTATFNLYLDGVLQDASTYQVLSTTPMNQQVKFNDTPTTGQAITVDMTYYYYCKFADNQLSFEEFLTNLHSIKKVTLRSCRQGT